MGENGGDGGKRECVQCLETESREGVSWEEKRRLKSTGKRERVGGETRVSGREMAGNFISIAFCNCFSIGETRVRFPGGRRKGIRAVTKQRARLRHLGFSDAVNGEFFFSMFSLLRLHVTAAYPPSTEEFISLVQTVVRV